MRQSVDEPAFVNICIATIRPSLVLKQPSKSVENLIFCENLTLINKVIVLFYRDQFKFETIWPNNTIRLHGILAVCQEVKWFNLVVFRDPLLLHSEEINGY